MLSEWLLAVDLIFVVDFEEVAALDRIDDGAEWLVVAHALEVVDRLQREWAVLWSTNFLQEEVVDWQVGIGEVEFNLATDLGRIAALFLAFEASLDIALVVAVVVTSTSTAAASASTSSSATASTTTATTVIPTTPVITIAMSAVWVTLVLLL